MEASRQLEPQLKLEDLRPREPEKKKFSDWFMPRRNNTILFDPAKCTGCGTCEMICSTRNVAKVAPRSEERRVGKEC